MQTSPPLLELENVCVTYGRGKRAFKAIDRVDLSVNEGEFVALLGPAGAGKTTLLQIITGLLKPTEGTVRYRAAPLVGVNPHATIVFQSFALFPWLTVQKNVEVALEARKVLPPLLTKRALKLLDMVGLDGFENAYPRELSGGMRQKVGFARAMALEPELLCLDEPFSALDVLSAEALRRELLELWEGGKIPTKAILIVTHNIEEAVFLARRIVVMDKQPGRVVGEIDVDLPYPRSRKAPEFIAVVDQVYARLAGHTQPETIEMGAAPGQAGRIRLLPNLPVTRLIGLLEQIAEGATDKVDIFNLASDLKVDSDQMLQLTDLAELLGFATIQQGDLTLTSLGETFAEASIQARKEIFSSRVRRLPIFKWLVDLLTGSESKQLSWDDIHLALEHEIPAEEATRQLETLVNWGRYAEILAYDDSQGLIYLESVSPAGDGATANS